MTKNLCKLQRLKKNIQMLKKGITGFGGKDPAPYFTDIRNFRGHCHEAARLCRGRVLAMPDPNAIYLACNYTTATFALSYQTIDLHINIHHPIIAFSEPGHFHPTEIRFRDCPELANFFGALGVYQIGLASQWESRVTQECLRELAKEELKQIAYWEPERLGDVVFNFWD